MRFQRRVESVSYSRLNKGNDRPSITLVAFAEMKKGQTFIKLGDSTDLEALRHSVVAGTC